VSKTTNAAGAPKEGEERRQKILVVEDEPDMILGLRDNFEFEGYEVVTASDGAAGLEKARTEKPDLMILDIMMPKLSGLEVCKTLRGEGFEKPIIMLTARGQEIDKVLGLKLGADDYVTKPFGFMELIARSEALLRRTGGRRSPGPLQLGDLTIDFQRHEARRQSNGSDEGRPVELSAREFRMLAFFTSRRGEVVTREALLDSVWDYRGAPLTRTVDMLVAKLRKKIEPDPHEPQYLITVHGLGYKLTEG
jgi:two-component system alkaline phosphatase synthesis response regulator PhoP